LALLIPYSNLHPLIAAEMIGNTSLPALVFAAYPIADHGTVIGVALPLDDLPVHKSPTLAIADRWICRDCFSPHVKLGNPGYVREELIFPVKHALFPV